MILKYLFSRFKYREAIVFKGGTSLSKVDKWIERLSEESGLALDWKVLGYGKTEPYEDRSNTKQLKFNDKINDDTKVFLRDEFLPALQNDFKEILKHKIYCFYIDEFNGIGNLIVLDSHINKSIQDNTVSEKITEYKNSQYAAVRIEFMKEYESCRDWDIEAVRKRADKEIEKIKIFMNEPLRTIPVL